MTEVSGAGEAPSAGRPLDRYQKTLGLLLVVVTLALLAMIVAVWPGPPQPPVVEAARIEAHVKAREEVARIERAHLALLQPRPDAPLAPEALAAEVRRLAGERAAALQKLAEESALIVVAARPQTACAGRLCLGPEPTLLALAAIAGALGSAVHAATSLAAHSGLGRMTPSWALWYYLRIPAGAALGLIAYCVVRAGFVIGTVSAVGSGAETINPFGVAAVSALAGISARGIMEKFGALAEGVFGAREPMQGRQQAASPAAPPRAVLLKDKKQIRLEFDREPKGLAVEIDGRGVTPAAAGKSAILDLRDEELARERLTLVMTGAGLAPGTKLQVTVPA